ncbi:MAG: DUF4153 domain-containing protein [Erysipelothrix sp.]|nr:DUF4153 domain-containing protein [Erysipelothrix sp.]
MNTFKTFFSKLKQRVSDSASQYPVALASGIIIAVLAVYKVGLDSWTSTSLIASIIQLALVVNIALSLALVSYYDIQDKAKLTIQLAIGIITPIVLSLVTYYFGTGPYLFGLANGYPMAEEIIIQPKAIYTLVALTIIFTLIYLWLEAKNTYANKFEQTFYILNRNFFSAIFFFIVMILGSFIVVSAYENLISNIFVSNIYEYLLIISGLIAYLIFLAYLANAYEGIKDLTENKFIKILFTNILTVIILALGLVLVLWVFTLLVGDNEVRYETLLAMVNLYFIVGLWVYINNANYQTNFTKVYGLAYPLISIVTLVLELWTILTRFGFYGIKVADYAAILVAIFGLIIAVLILIKQKALYNKMITILITLLVISILPFTGIYNLPYMQQYHRLKNTLVANDMLNGDVIVAKENLDKDAKYIITDATNYLLTDARYTKSTLLAGVANENAFKETFGFLPIYTVDGGYNQNYLTFELEEKLVDVSAYNYVLARDPYGEINEMFSHQDQNYKLTLTSDDMLRLTIDGDDVIAESLTDFFKNIEAKGTATSSLTLADMSVAFESETVNLYIVFDFVGVTYENDVFIYREYRVPIIYFNFK